MVSVARTLLKHYRGRTTLGLVLMASQAFVYNAIFFTYALILTKFYSVPADKVGLYILPFAIGNFIRDAVEGRTIRITGDGTPLRSYLYASDMAAWLWRILFDGTAGEAYNVGGTQALTIGELAHLVDQTLGAGVGVECLKAPAPGQPAERYIPDVGRARGELGLDAWTDLPDAIRRTAHWYRDTTRGRCTALAAA